MTGMGGGTQLSLKGDPISLPVLSPTAFLFVD